MHYRKKVENAEDGGMAGPANSTPHLDVRQAPRLTENESRRVLLFYVVSTKLVLL